MNRLAVIERELPIFERTIHRYFKLRIGAFDGTQIAGMLLGDGLEACPLRVVIRDVDFLYGWEIEDTQVVVLRFERPGGYVVLHVFRQPREHELIVSCPAC